MNDRLLRLLQLTSPSLPLGAYSYSEGLETLVEIGSIDSQQKLAQWLEHQLNYGAIRTEAALMLRAYRCLVDQDFLSLNNWNDWASASKETSELRQQSWQMGGSLLGLLRNLAHFEQDTLENLNSPCNYSIAFGVAAFIWKITEEDALLGYLSSWASNAIGAGVKLIPLGQTAGQQLLFNLYSQLNRAAEQILIVENDDLIVCNWGTSLASMAHEIQYTRLFRS